MAVEDVTFRRTRLSETKRALLSKLLQSSADAGEAVTISKQPRAGGIPLSFAEQRLWFLDKLASSTAAYTIAAPLRLMGKFRPLTLEQTLNEIIRRHETLRTTFGGQDGQAVQIISARASFELPVVDISCLPLQRLDNLAEKLATEAVCRTFNLATGPLLRVVLVRLAPEEHLLLIAMHHIISDGWSIGVLVSELSSIYNSFSEASGSTLPELRVQYADFAIWQRERLQGAVLDEQLSFWKNLLKGAPELIDLATDRPRPPIPSFRGASVPLNLTPEVGQCLKSLCQQSGATLFMGLLAAFQTLLFRYTGNPDAVVGSPIANRNYQELEPLIGFFVNSLAFRGDLSDDPCFSTLLDKVKETTLEAYAHQELPFERIVEEMAPDRDIGYNPLFQVLIAHQSAPVGALNLGGAIVAPQSFKSPYTHFDLEFHLWDEADGIRGFVVYSTDLFDRSTIQRMAAHFQNCIRAAALDPFTRVSGIQLLGQVESHHIISEWNAACLNFRTDRCVHQLVEEQGNVRPDAAAVYADENVLTYGEMNRRANQLAHRLRAQGVRAESIVAVVMSRSTDWIVAMLGILKAGGAYACFDLANPQGRIWTMVKDCGARVLVTHAGTGTDTEPAVADVILIDDVWDSGGRSDDEGLRELADERNPSYVVYTSGSTGKPKGVVTSHGALLNLVYWHRDRWKVVVDDKGSQVAQSGFDAAVWEIWPYLSAGASISIADKYSRISADKLCDWLVENEITIGWLPPVLSEPLLQVPDLVRLKMRILFAGADRLLMRPSSSARFEYVNIYGPTEAAAITTTGPVAREGDEAGAPDIGRPIHNDQVYILDRRFGPNPISAPGQLCIGGNGLARGYLGAQELTAEKFSPDPFGAPGSRMYKTGDLVRLRPDGKIDFIARIDHQVKIRGFRIELGEIESALLESNLVREAVVIGSQGPGSSKQLVAYVAPATDRATAGELQDLEENYVSRWQSLYDETYAGSQARDPEFDITGWNSSYTGAPIPAEEMREWRDSVLTVILAEGPERVLEIGAGTGLLLYQLAGKCKEYWGTDFSAVSIGRLERHIKQHAAEFGSVRLLERPAEDFEGIPAEYFDVAVINSVIQYFPGWEYLERVLAGAITCTRPGGVVFVGDVRNLELLEALRTSVEIQISPDALSTEEVCNRIRRGIEREEELLVSPEFFLGLKERQPAIGALEIRLKRGRAHNELTKYRYDLLLHVGPQIDPISPEDEIDWQNKGMTPEGVWNLLEREKPFAKAIKNIPNSRLATDLRALEVLKSAEAPANVEGVKKLCHASPSGIDPESICTIHDQYEGTLFWSSDNVGGVFDVLFTRRRARVYETSHGAVSGRRVLPRNVLSGDGLVAREPGLCTNLPVRADVEGQLVPKLKAYLRERVPEYMVPSGFVVLDRLPRNPNGKVDRKSLPALAEARRDEDETYVGPVTPEQEILASLWGRLLGLERVGIEDNFFELGGHSLLATQVVSAARDIFKVVLPLAEFFTSPTIAELAEKITAGRLSLDIVAQIKPADRSDRAPLSFAEQRLWFLDRLDSRTGAYIIRAALKVIGEFRSPTLEQTLNEIIRRHETLRTSFGTQDGEAVQIIAPRAILELPVIDLSRVPARERDFQAEQLATQAASAPFDLAAGPLIRTLLMRVGPREHMLIITMHHIISDGWSIGVLVKELSSIYNGFSQAAPSALPELPIQYADFAIWQRERLRGAVLDEQLSFWKNQLEGAPEVINLATDRPRPPRPSFRGAKVPLELPADLGQGLKRMCQDSGATLFMGILAAFQLLLFRYTGNPDVVVGSPIANRNYRELEPLIGFFVNSLALRGDLSEVPAFTTHLVKVKESTLEAYAHQELPFERIVEELRPSRDIGHNPLFQVSIALQSAPVGELNLGGARVALQTLKNLTTRFDLEFQFWDHADLIRGFIIYSTDLFDETTVQRIVAHFQNVIGGAVLDPSIKVTGIELLTQVESHQIISEWNAPHLSYPNRCVHELAEEQASVQPDAPAVYSDGNVLSYGEMDRRANRLAHRLRLESVGADSVVAVVMSRSMDWIVAMLGILKAGGGYACFDPSNPAERIRTMMTDCGARVLITQDGAETDAESSVTTVINIDGYWDFGDWPGDLRNVPVERNVAYVVYTSGSTGKPKGVVTSHGALLNLVYWHRERWRIEVTDRGSQIARTGFDAAVWEIWPYLTAGASISIVDEYSRLSADKLCHWLIENEITIGWLPPVLAEPLLQLPELGRLKMRILFSGADRLLIRPPLSARFDYVNIYGPTEAAAITTSGLVGREEVGTPDIGRPVYNAQIYILDQVLGSNPIGIPGQLCIGGQSLARGYLGAQEMTAEKFCPDPFGAPGSRIYKTGDLARLRPDGRIDFITRIDHQLKVRGFRIELGEIESALLESNLVREVVVIGGQGAGSTKQLIAYVVPDLSTNQPVRSEIDGKLVAKLETYLGKRLPEYMVPATFVAMERLPRNTNGKVDRKSLPAPAEATRDGDDTYVRPKTPEQEILAMIWGRLLGLQRVGIEDDFFDLGGHSLLATQLISAVRDIFKVELPMAQLFINGTIAAVEARITAGRLLGDVLPEIKPATRRDRAPLSLAQQRLWFIDQLTPGSSAYNMPLALRIKGPASVERIEEALREIVRRHEALRTRFSGEGEPEQIISPLADLRMAVCDLTALSGEALEATARNLAERAPERPFNLQQGPLIRCAAVRLRPAEILLLVTMHHIVSDGWSLGILMREFGDMYRWFSKGESSGLGELDIQYGDYAVWQRQWIVGDVLNRQINYWREVLGDGAAVAEMPTDRERPTVESFEGAALPISIPEADVRGLRELARNEGATLFMTLLAGFQTLVHRYSGAEEIRIGTPIAGRNRSETERLIGFFVNTLIMRAGTRPEISFRELLREVRDSALEAYANQDAPFEKLVEELHPNRDLGRNPLFQILLALQNTPMKAEAIAGLKLSAQEQSTSTSRFDLELQMRESEGGLEGAMIFKTGLFDASTISRVLHQYKVLLRGIADTPDASLSELPLMPGAERAQLVASWSSRGADVDPCDLVNELFEEQVERTPDSIAVAWRKEYTTYSVLNEMANGVAGGLYARGVKPQSRIGVCLERNGYLVAGVIGILKAGCAYVPLDPAYPAERIRMIARDAELSLVLAESGFNGLFEAEGIQTLAAGEIGEYLTKTNKRAGWSDIDGCNVAYIIYTSGSTGVPKGVEIEHGSVGTMLRWASSVYSAEERARVLGSTSICFDLSVFEVFLPLTTGGTVVVAENALELAEHEARYDITLINTVPSAMTQLVRMGAVKKSVVTVNLAGEALPRPLVNAVYGLETVKRVYNLYGPTEDTTYSTFELVGREESGRPGIGRPINGTDALILDGSSEPVAEGITGELHLAGAGLARGYFGKADITAERFVPSPFGDRAGERVYRTGDQVRYSAGGSLEFVGRSDNQVKIRGFRIELGEIEAALDGYPGIRDGVVVLRENERKEQILVAYVAPSERQGFESGELRGYLKSRLPEYMMPAMFVELGELPRTPNGKVDRNALPGHEAFPLALAESYVEPSEGIEKTIAALWCEALHTERVGANDNFFDLGGNSMSIIILKSKMALALNRQILTAEMFHYPTVRSMAEYLSRGASDDTRGLDEVEETARSRKRLIEQQRQARRRQQK
jgi:pristinamycin I synthase 3 and 4